MEKSKKDGMTRRDFAKVSAISSFAIVSGRSAAALKTNSDTLKVGLIGCGGRGTGAARDMLTGDDNVMIVALADVFEDKVRSARKGLENHEDAAISGKCAVDDDHCFAGLDAYKKFLKTDIDIMITGTLPYCRPLHVAAAVKAGKHIFMEKPAAVDPDGIRVMIEAAEKAREKKLSIVAGTQRRHQKEYVETVKKIQDGAIGDVRALRAYWCGGLPFARDRNPKWTSDLEYAIRNWYGYCWMAGDSIVEQHVHNLDVCNWIMGGPPKTVFAMGGRTWKPRESDGKYGDIYDHFACDYEYENGVHMQSLCRHWHNCTTGVFEEATGTTGSSNCSDMGESGVNPYVQEHTDLVNSIRGTGEYLNEGKQVAESTMTAIIGRMAAYTGNRISFKRAMKESLNLVPDDLSFDKEYPVGPVPSPGA